MFYNQAEGIIAATKWSIAHCRAGNSAGAVDDLASAVRFWQNVSSANPAWYLMGLRSNEDLIEFAGLQAHKLFGGGSTRLSQLFETGISESWFRAFEQEANTDDQLADKLTAMSPEEAMRELNSLLSRQGIGSATESMEPAQAISAVRQGAKLAREWAGALTWTEQDRWDRLTRLQSSESTDAIGNLFLSGIEVCLEMTDAVKVGAAMFAAGMDVMSRGQNVLSLHLDPATGQPFIYTQSSDGFELESDYQVDGQPLKLRFK
jgi:hypothetical protein